MRGNITRRGKRSWRIKVDLGGTDPVTGKRRTRYHTVKGTKADAQTEAAKIIANVATGGYIEPTKVTVSEFIERWLRDWASLNVSSRTRKVMSNCCASTSPGKSVTASCRNCRQPISRGSTATYDATGRLPE